MQMWPVIAGISGVCARRAKVGCAFPPTCVVPVRTRKFKAVPLMFCRGKSTLLAC